MAAVPVHKTGALATGPAATGTQWLSYHGDPARTGYVAGLPAAGKLAVAWAARLDGAVYGEPLVVGTVVVAATEADSVYGLERGTGRVLWHRIVGAPEPGSELGCGDITPLGITSTPVFDPRTGLVYVLAQDEATGHVLVGLDPATGTVRYRRTVPSPDGHPAADQQRGALAAGFGRIYVTFGGHAGDCGPYVGSVVAMPDRGSGPVVGYKVPTARQAGIWAPGGPVIFGGKILVSVGNGTTRGPFDRSDSVTELTPGLSVSGYFAPASWLADNRGDLDLGSMTPALVGGDRILIVGKSGMGYLLRVGRLGGVGGELASRAICGAFGGAAVTGTTVFVPCAGGGTAAVGVGADRLTVLWRGPAGANGSPVAGGGAIWVTSYPAGQLYELNPATGAIRYQIGLGARLPHFSSPVLSGPLVLVGTLDGLVAIDGA